MENKGHTPGPWRIERKRHHVQILHDQRGKGDGYNNRVAETVQWSPASGPQTPPSEALANARLIAAAPDLLGAHECGEADLQFLRRAIEEGDPKAELLIRVDDMLRRTRAAIARATEGGA